MDNLTLKIGEREIPLRFKMPQFAQIEEEIGYLGDIKELIIRGKKRIRNIIGVIRIMGNAGLKAAGQEADLTDEWLEENMNPHELMAYQLAVIACMDKEGKSQAQEEKNENTERDLVLEEIQAKKDPVNSRSGE